MLILIFILLFFIKKEYVEEDEEIPEIEGTVKIIDYVSDSMMVKHDAWEIEIKYIV